MAAGSPAQTGGGAASAQKGTGTVTISVGLAAQSFSRRLAYVSSATKSATVTMTPAIGPATSTSVNCTNTCSATMTVPIGLDQFAVNLYDKPNGMGNVLASGTTSLQVFATQTNTLTLVFNGVIASLAISYDVTKLVAGQSSTIPLSVAAKDPSGAVIIGPDPYTTPITLTDSDTTGTLRLSTTTLNTPVDAINMLYSGGQLNSVTVGASSGSATSSIVVNAGAAGGGVGLTIPVPGPSTAGIPSHVLTYLYYGAGNVNTNVPAAFMAAHADFAESSEQQTSIAAAFKSAGGRFAVIYSDPSYQPHCNPPFSQPAGACTGPIAQLITSESGYDHDASGNRVYRSYAGGYQEVLNIGSAAAEGAYRQFTQNMVNLTSSIDLFFADDSGQTFTNGGGDPLTGFFYNFSAAAVEQTSDASFITQEKAMLASAVRPVIVNGNDQTTWQPSYNGTFLTAPNVQGENHEGCFNNSAVGLMGDANNYFTKEADSLLVNTADGRYAVCMMNGPDTPANRLYQLAAWWLTYDSAHSVAGPTVAASDGYAIFPEYDLVPANPVRTASTDVTVLRTSPTGAYAREFGTCYQNSGALGACAAVINTTAGTLAMPSLSRSYTHALVLNDASSYTTGTVQWTAAPTSLGALSAVILLQ